MPAMSDESCDAVVDWTFIRDLNGEFLRDTTDAIFASFFSDMYIKGRSRIPFWLVSDETDLN